jgi:uncharacterized membrane protein YbhN (UPF0104 family)
MLAYFVVEVAAAFRWHVLLKVQGIRLSVPRLSGLFLIGMFYNQFLPGGTGGDIIKSYFLLKETDRKAGALLAVVFDRFIGLVALVAITVTLVSLRFDLLAQTHETRRYLWFLLILLGISIVCFLRADVAVTNFFAVMPIERTISALPISFAGVGLREKVLQTMLHQVCGVGEGVAVLIGSLSFLIMVLCCLPGGIVYFFYKPSGVVKRVKLRQMQREVATAEHEIPEPQ